LRYNWAWWLNSFLINLKSKAVTLEKNDYNRDFQSTRTGQNAVSTGQDFDVSSILSDDHLSSLGEVSSQPRFEPIIMRFYAPMTLALSQMLNDNRHSIFSVETESGPKYGYIRKVPTVPGKLSEFELIKASRYAVSSIT